MNPAPTAEQLRRLPSYVIRYIDSLERKVADLEYMLADKTIVKSNVWTRQMHPYSDLPLEKDAEIRFDMVDSDETHDDAFMRAHYIDVRHSSHDSSMLTVNGASRLLIHPWASNHFYVSIAPR